MTRIDDGFTKVDSTDAYSDSAVFPQEPERRRSQQSRQGRTPTVISDDDSTTDSDVALDGSYVSTFNTQADGSNGASYLAYIEDIPGVRSLRKVWGSKKVVLIAVMGMTGSGKTTFISKVTGRNDLEIGHGLASCTKEIQIVETVLDGRTVRFVDTPGFSDTYLSDSEVLEMIADYLVSAYSQKIRLSGIIYLHPISDNRVTHHATRNLDMFQKLTGKDNLKNVVLTTSMWDKDTEGERVKREQELKTEFWSVPLAFGAQYSRHDGTESSAKRIASMLVRNEPFFLQLQEEMGKGNKALKDTAAGQEIMIELSRMKERHQAELADMEKLLRSSAEENKAAVAALEQHYKKMLRDMERTLADEKRMNEDAVKSLTERINALEKRGQGFCAIM